VAPTAHVSAQQARDYRAGLIFVKRVYIRRLTRDAGF